MCIYVLKQLDILTVIKSLKALLPIIPLIQLWKFDVTLPFKSSPTLYFCLFVYYFSYFYGLLFTLCFFVSFFVILYIQLWLHNHLHSYSLRCKCSHSEIFYFYCRSMRNLSMCLPLMTVKDFSYSLRKSNAQRTSSRAYNFPLKG